MSDWWWVLIVAVVLVVVAGVLYQRSRRTGVSGGSPHDASRNYGDEREAARLGGMSEADRAWESASRERNREAQASEQSSHQRRGQGRDRAKANRRQTDRWDSEGGAIPPAGEDDDTERDTGR